MDLRAKATTASDAAMSASDVENGEIQLINCLKKFLLETTKTSRKEAFCWVYDSMGARTDEQDVRGKFTQRLLRELVPSDEGFSKALLLYFCEYGSANVFVELISPAEWRKFFLCEDKTSSARKLKSFFGNFRIDGEHLKGAKALQQYALRRRNELWHHLRWQKNSQSPVVCATKPGTFCELDVEKTLHGPFGEDKNGFWSSDDFVKCLRESAKETIVIDCAYFVNLLFARLRFSGNNSDVVKLRRDLYNFLMQRRHVYNCQRLLPVIRKENDVLKLANVLFHSDWDDVEDLCLAIALTFRARVFANALSEDIVTKLLSHDIAEINAPTKLAKLCQYFVVRMKLTRDVLDVEEVMTASGIQFDRIDEEKRERRKKRRKERREDERENEKYHWRLDGDSMAISLKSDLVDRILERFILITSI